MKLSAEDRDHLVRTIIGEAGFGSEDEQGAVAHTLLNRLKSDKYLDTAREVALEMPSWQGRTRELSSIHPKSKVYSRAGDIFDRAASGDLPDPTKGGTDYPPK